LRAHSSAPTRENSPNCTPIATAEPIIALRPSGRERHESTRCAMSWSEPCEPMVSSAPPTTAVTNAYGLVRIGFEKSNTVNFPASPAAAHPAAPTCVESTTTQITAPRR
jgi:hypothetical protein